MAAPGTQLLNEDLNYTLRYKVKMGETGGVRNLLKDKGCDPLEGGDTLKKWTPLHIACWGSVKPASDKDIVEALLLWAQKSNKEQDMRNAADTEGCTPADIARIRRDQAAALPGGEEGGPALEEKRKYDKIVEWLEKGLPTA